MQQQRNKILALGTCVALGLALGLLTAGCYASVGVGPDDEYLEVGGPPPPIQADVEIAAPGPGYVWVGGHYDWAADRKDYAWTQGSWQRPPHGGAHWVAPRYEKRGEKHIYHPGHWHD
jgi:hypothetical protein